MIFWYEKDPKYNEITTKVKELFKKNNIEVPRRILPPTTMPEDNAEKAFMIRMNSIALKKCVELKTTINKTEQSKEYYRQWKNIYRYAKKQLRAGENGNATTN